MNQTFLFDFDGTVADSVSLTLKAIKEIIRKYTGNDLTDTEINELRNMRVQDVIKRLHISVFRIPFFAQELRKSLRFDYQSVQPVKDIPRVLRQLNKKGHGLGIVTSNSEENVKSFLAKNEIEIFDYLYAGSSLFGKANILNKVIKEKRLERKEVFYIGDETRDIDAAKKCQIQSIAVTWGINTKEILAKQTPTYCIDSPHDLLTIAR